ncbi:MAG: hypothetical protein U1G08_09855 [Verrucomicrobiota bacterium]
MAAVLWGRANTGFGPLDFQHWRGAVLGGDIVDLAFASKRVVILKSDGTLASFGLTGDPENTLPSRLSNIVEIESTSRLGYALDRTGTLWPLNSPAFPSLPRSIAIRCGWNILVGITLNGGVFYTDRLGSLVSVPGVSDAVAIAAGDEFGAALLEDGSVTVFGNFPGAIPTEIRNAARIVAGPNHLVVLHTDGSVTAYGKAKTKLLKVPAELRDPVEIVIGTGHAVALQRDGTILCWGDNEAGQCRPPPGLSNVVSIATAFTHCMAATADGKVVTWGLLWLEDISAPPRVESGVTRVMSGHEFLVALGPPTTPVLLKSPTNVTVFPWQSARFEAAARGLGHTFEWRWNGRLLPESDSPVLEFAATDVGLGPSEYGRFSVTVRGPDGSAINSPEVTLTVHPDSQPGTILEWKKDDLPATPVDPQIQGHALRIAADDQTRAAILDDGSLQLDPSDKPSRRIPGSSSGRPESVAICGSFVRVVTSDHRVREFYRDGTERTGIPTELYENVLRVAPGPGAITVLKTDGSVWTLDPQQNVVQLSKGPARDVALGGRGFTVIALADGTVDVISPPTDLIPPPLRGVVAVAAGQDHAVALLEDGTVAAWGGN